GCCSDPRCKHQC
uniref:Alpha-conotoxin-like Reg1b/Reg1c n=1 Tax=Conus regius TaxID=101314 RepID=CA1B_CONRE|nr:RecName: Full=Alpha-conotoxin-like Reg1b/Reg1c [Conus regius]